MRAAQLIESKAQDLIKRRLNTLVPCLLWLRDAIGDVDLDPEMQSFVSWMLNWDPPIIESLAALAAAIRGQQRKTILARANNTGNALDQHRIHDLVAALFKACSMLDDAVQLRDDARKWFPEIDKLRRVANPDLPLMAGYLDDDEMGNQTGNTFDPDPSDVG